MVDVTPSRAQHGMNKKKNDTTHTQNQWPAKGVVPWQPEQSGHTQLQETRSQKALKATAQNHTKSRGEIYIKSQLSYGHGGKRRSSTNSNLVRKTNKIVDKLFQNEHK